MRWDRPGAVEQALGEYLSEPKAQVWFAPGTAAGCSRPACGWTLAPACCTTTRNVFINGESWRAAGRDAAVLRRLADQRYLTSQAVRRASGTLREVMAQWARLGWLMEWQDE